MNNKIIGIFIIMLLILTALPVIGISEKIETGLSFNDIKNGNNKSQALTYGSPIVVIEWPEEEVRTYCLPDINILGFAEDDIGVVSYSILHEYGDESILIIADLFKPYPHYDFNIPVTLEIGWNRITITFEDEGLQTGEDSLIAYYDSTPDTKPPTLDIESPGGVIFFKPDIKVKFHATDNCGVIIYKILHEYSDGSIIISIDYITPWPIDLSFEWNFQLEEGLNKITAHAIDIGGHEVDTSITVLYIRTRDYNVKQNDEINRFNFNILRNKAINPLLHSFLHSYPNLFPILRLLFQ